MKLLIFTESVVVPLGFSRVIRFRNTCEETTCKQTTKGQPQMQPTLWKSSDASGLAGREREVAEIKWPSETAAVQHRPWPKIFVQSVGSAIGRCEEDNFWEEMI